MVRLLVITVMLLNCARCGTICSTVLPASKISESPSAISATAALAMWRFYSVLIWVLRSIG